MKKEKIVQKFWDQADLHIKNKNFEKALTCLLECNALLKNNENILNGIALVQVELKNFSEAKKFFIQSLSIDITQYNTHLNLGKCNEVLDLEDESLMNYNAALKYQPQLVDALVNRALILQRQKQSFKAKKDMEHAISIEEALNNDGIEELYFAMSNILSDIDDNENAKYFIDKALTAKPDDIRYKLTQGTILLHLGEPKENLISFYKDILKDHPESSGVICNLGFVYMHHNEFVLAEKYFVSALALNNQNFDAMHNLGNVQLSIGNFEEGWKNYEARHQINRLDGHSLLKSIPEWTSASSNNNNTLIWGEQGIGDQILYSSMISEHFFDPSNTTIAVHKKIVALFKKMFPKYTIVSLDTLGEIREKFDAQIVIGNLGKYLRLHIDDFKDKSYNVTIAKSIYKKKKKFLCGISWKSNAGKDKSCALEELLPLLSLKNIEFVNLQYGDVSEELALLHKMHGIQISEVKDLNLFDNIDGVASLINACDFIITTSNINAHLAGILKKDTYLLTAISIKKFHYWHSVKGISTWYNSVKIFDQKNKGDWSMPIQKCQKLIKDLSC